MFYSIIIFLSNKHVLMFNKQVTFKKKIIYFLPDIKTFKISAGIIFVSNVRH